MTTLQDFSFQYPLQTPYIKNEVRDDFIHCKTSLQQTVVSEIKLIVTFLSLTTVSSNDERGTVGEEKYTGNVRLL